MSKHFTTLLKYAKQRYNVMLIGSHGVGKTVMMKDVAKHLDLRFKYYSASTLDPWADLVGVPVPVDSPEFKKKVLKFIRSESLETVQFIFFDELNRSHKKVQNAVMELIQFFSLNDDVLPQLQMVWAAINPPNSDYHVNKLDDALMDRFHKFIHITPKPTAKYFESIGLDFNISKKVLEWWNPLSKELKEVVSPRRLEYLIKDIMNGNYDLHDSFNPLITDKVIPIQSLEQLIKSSMNAEDFKQNANTWDVSDIDDNIETFVRMSQGSESHIVAEVFKKMDLSTFSKYSKKVVPLFPPEIQFELLEHFEKQLGTDDGKKALDQSNDLKDWTDKTRSDLVNRRENMNNVASGIKTKIDGIKKKKAKKTDSNTESESEPEESI